MKRTIALLFLAMLFVGVGAQKRDKQLVIEVTSVENDDLTGQPLTLLQTDYEVSYGQLELDADGRCSLKVFAGNHHLTIDREGFDLLEQDFEVTETPTVVNVTLREKTRQPYALTASVMHDAMTGRNDIALAWNTEQPAFFDDFESYEGWSINFGDWTGIDADNEAAAALLGSYPNRGVMQYAQIINPLTVNPTWWYDYPILLPYDGQQYVGFTRTSSGNANDDWLISPTITVGTDNVLQFLGKAGDQFPERFMVYVTTKTDNPVQSDFVRIDQGNYETADYRGWQLYSYDLSAYAGQQIKFAIRYVSHYNMYGSFMLMIDDVYVGQALASQNSRKSRFSQKSQRHRSPANANETFRIFLDGQLVDTTEDYEYTIEDVTAGKHTVGVQAVYLQAESETTMMTVSVAPATDFSHVTFHVTADSKLSADGVELSLLSLESAESYLLTVSGDKAEVASLPNGQYVVNVEQGAFEEYRQTITVEGDATIDIVLADYIITPYNITATSDEDGNTILRWNQELSFTDSFEDYDDFATGTFGEWKSIDRDQQPVYPIALGSQSNIVSFPGSGTATNPKAVAPMVFNPWKTTPAMLPTDPAIAAPTGDKSVIFFSPQRTKADKWLISPLLDIHDDYQLSITAKGYTSMYPESMELCISDGSDNPDDFKVLSVIDPVSSEQWAVYHTDLSDYAGQQVRLAVHYTSNDAFLAQIDDFTVGPASGQGAFVDYGNVVRFDIYLDGEKIGESRSPSFVIEELTEDYHIIGICAVYENGQSEMAYYEIGTTTAVISHLTPLTSHPSPLYDLQGRKIDNRKSVNRKLPKGIYVMDGKKVVLK